MKLPSFLAIQCTLFGFAVGLPPALPSHTPIPSYKFGINGEPTKMDTAFGNLGELGPQYETPSGIRTDTTPTSTLIKPEAHLSPQAHPTTPRTSTAKPGQTTTEETGGGNNDFSESEESGFEEIEHQNVTVPTQTFNTTTNPVVPMVSSTSSTAAPTVTTGKAPQTTTQQTLSPPTTAAGTTTPATTPQPVTTSKPEATTSPSSTAAPSSSTSPEQHNSTSTDKPNSSTMNQPPSTYLSLIFSTLIIYQCLSN